MKISVFTKVFCSIFAVIGIILLLSDVLIYVSGKKFVSTADEITGVISNIETYRDSDNDRHHRVYVTYTYRGKEYSNVRVSLYSSNMYEGKEIILYCNPEKPGNIVIKGTEILALIILTNLGIIFTCIGIIPIIVLSCKIAKKKKIRFTGRCLYATVDEVRFDKGYTVNGRHPYVIYCNYQDCYKDIIYHFKSERLWIDYEPAFMVGSVIKVYVEENNYKNYYVDAESMIQDKIVNYT